MLFTALLYVVYFLYYFIVVYSLLPCCVVYFLVVCCAHREETVSAKFGAVVQLSDFLETNGVFYRVKVTNKGTLEGGVSVLAIMTSKVQCRGLGCISVPYTCGYAAV